MVSFFGIKLGSDRKKEKAQQNKQQNEKASQLRKGSNNDKKVARESQYFGNNFSRPNASASPRPGTSYSTRRTTLFHQPFTFPPASSSMVDLAPPGRRPSVGSIRQHASDADLKGLRDHNESPVPPPVLSPPTRRPGTADRPLSSRKSAWINPLDVHYVRNRDSTPGNGPETPPTNSESAAVSPFSDFEFGVGSKKSGSMKTEQSVHPEGYPSPPASINSIDPLSSVPIVNPDNRPSSSRRNAPPSGLRRVNTLDEIEGPPTPERTVSQTSEDQHLSAIDSASSKPVVRNVRAKRETLAFHQPRQPSMIMDFDGAPEKRWERDANDDTQRSPPVEGFEGNFAAFDFGETVRRGSVSTLAFDADKRSTAHTMHTISNFSGHPSLDTMGSALAAQWPSPPTDDNDTSAFGGRERTLSDARSFASLSTKRDDAYKSSAPPVNLDSPIIPPDHFRARDFIPPRPHTSGGPRPSTGTPSAAAGAHRGGLAGLDPPPRGFLSRPRVGSASGPSTRAPPKPLQLRPLAPESSPRNSPFGPPPDEGSYLRTEGDTRQPPEPSPYGPTLEGEGNYMRSEGSTRRPPEIPGSPFARATPIEGDFPVSKGLPRGRRPTFPSQPTPTSEDTTAPSPSPGPDNTTALGLPSWIDRANTRQSAMPAPLTPLRGTGFTSSARPPTSPHRPLRSDEFNFPATPTSTTITSGGAPRLPSPTFYSLEKSISSSSDDLARTFVDFSFDSKPLISPVMAEFGGSGSSPRRVEGRTAPPRPSPVTLPPSSGEGVKSVRPEVSSTFI